MGADANNFFLFAIGKVSDTDRRRICNRITKLYSYSEREADHAFSTLLIILSGLAYYENAIFSPGKVLDDVWHEFIIHTKPYIRFCRSLGKDYIHHDPVCEFPSQQKSAYFNVIELLVRDNCLKADNEFIDSVGHCDSCTSCTGHISDAQTSHEREFRSFTMG